LDVEVHTPHAHRTGHHWIDMTVAVAAIFISVVSLAVAILHGRTMERMAEENARLVAANSWPFMQYGAGWATTDGVTRVNMAVFNSGVGPAKIESAELMWKGVAYRGDREFLAACCGFDPARGRRSIPMLFWATCCARVLRFVSSNSANRQTPPCSPRCNRLSQPRSSIERLLLLDFRRVLGRVI
jgi:hypothetical protein